jgi:hypothetical protein
VQADRLRDRAPGWRQAQEHGRDQTGCEHRPGGRAPPRRAPAGRRPEPRRLGREPALERVGEAGRRQARLGEHAQAEQHAPVRLV